MKGELGNNSNLRGGAIGGRTDGQEDVICRGCFEPKNRIPETKPP